MFDIICVGSVEWKSTPAWNRTPEHMTVKVSSRMSIAKKQLEETKAI
jgi:hypothetical protein